MSNKIIIFIKNPVLGKVKTRIAVDIGDQEALEIYKALLHITRLITTPLEAEKLLFYSDTISVDDDWDINIYRKYRQEKGNLGVKMCAAFKTCFDTSIDVVDKVLIIGSDCPYLNKEIISQAFHKLEENDVVIGPTYDGGYYLLGMKKLHTELFQDILWSSDQVFKSTVAKIQNLGLTYAETEKLHDIDTYTDWLRFIQ